VVVAVEKAVVGGEVEEPWTWRSSSKTSPSLPLLPTPPKRKRTVPARIGVNAEYPRCEGRSPTTEPNKAKKSPLGRFLLGTEDWKGDQGRQKSDIYIILHVTFPARQPGTASQAGYCVHVAAMKHRQRSEVDPPTVRVCTNAAEAVVGAAPRITHGQVAQSGVHLLGLVVRALSVQLGNVVDKVGSWGNTKRRLDAELTFPPHRTSQ
jgi:hypothetical protein